MGFWIFMFIITLLIPAALLLTWYLCPKLKTINNASGYRTKQSMKNQDTWDFAQKHRVINMSIDRIGWIGLGITIIQMISFVVIIISTEKSLKNTFDESGNRV